METPGEKSKEKGDIKKELDKDLTWVWTLLIISSKLLSVTVGIFFQDNIIIIIIMICIS